MGKCTIGLDFGTNSVRAVLVDVNNGEEIATSVCNYTHGEEGVILADNEPHLARQHPGDYVEGTRACIREVMAKAGKQVSGKDVSGIGVDTTGSTPIPVDESGKPLAFCDEFKDDPNAMAWLWKDHTSHAEAEEITVVTAELHPEYLAKCGGTYSPEWFWSKTLHCLRKGPKVYESAYSWVELADWIPAVLTGTTEPKTIKRCICAAGHKAMFNPKWGGYPDEKLLAKLDPGLARLRRTLPSKAYTIAQAAGGLTKEWAGKLGLPAGVPVAIGALDGHMGAVGSGIRPGVLVKILGTSSCDMVVCPMDKELPDIPGVCGIVPESILPGHFGLEAGQAAVGDIFNWFVSQIQPGGETDGSHEELTKEAEQLRPGGSGLLGLDWHNGNRNVLADQRLSGLLVGMTLATKPAEIYRALIESTAFGARVIAERFEQYGIDVERIINCGGISAKNPMVMQIYSDVMGRPLEISRSDQSCALGSAMAGAVVAGRYESFDEAGKGMTAVQRQRFTPNPDNRKVYDQLYGLYKRMHDAFGIKGADANLHGVMRDLLAIRENAKA